MKRIEAERASGGKAPEAPGEREALCCCCRDYFLPTHGENSDFNIRENERNAPAQ